MESLIFIPAQEKIFLGITPGYHAWDLYNSRPSGTWPKLKISFVADNASSLYHYYAT